MKILFISLGASSWADGRATENSDYDLYIVYEGYDKEIQVSDLKHNTVSKIYEIDIQGHPKKEFEKLIEQCEEIPIFNLEGAQSNPEQLLVYIANDYTLYEQKAFYSINLRNSFSKKISHTVGKKQGKSSKARHKFFNPKNDNDYIKGMKCFYFAWKLTLYAIQLAKPENQHHIVDFYEPYAFGNVFKKSLKTSFILKKAMMPVGKHYEFEFKTKFKGFKNLLKIIKKILNKSKKLIEILFILQFKLFMSIMDYYMGPYNVEHSLPDAYYSTTFQVTSHSVVLGGYELQARIKVESVSSETKSTMDSFIIKYGEVLYAIEIGLEDDGYENTTVHLLNEDVSIEKFYEFDYYDPERYSYHKDCIPYCLIHDYMEDENTESISNMSDFHFSDFILINY